MSETELKEARDQFISRWGTLGSTWGISRAMSQIHALLLVAEEPLSTDDVMAALSMSRGSANTNLRELVTWGLISKVGVKGDRKDYFVAEKDVWKMFCIIARERKRREVEPMLKVLGECLTLTKGSRTSAGRAFHDQIKAIEEFATLASGLLDKVAASERSKIVPAVLKVLK